MLEITELKMPDRLLTRADFRLAEQVLIERYKGTNKLIEALCDLDADEAWWFGPNGLGTESLIN